MNVPESFTLKYEKRSWKNTYYLGNSDGSKHRQSGSARGLGVECVDVLGFTSHYVASAGREDWGYVVAKIHPFILTPIFETWLLNGAGTKTQFWRV